MRDIWIGHVLIGRISGPYRWQGKNIWMCYQTKDNRLVGVKDDIDDCINKLKWLAKIQIDMHGRKLK